jgi:hypothetical protein
VGFGVWGLGFEVLDFRGSSYGVYGVWVQGLQDRVQGLESRVQGAGCRV